MVQHWPGPEYTIWLLNSIKSQYPDVHDCLREMLQLWLTATNPDPSWEVLVDALNTCIVGEGQLAARLREKYCRVRHQQGIQ